MPVRKIPVSWTTGIGGVGVSIFYSIDSVDVTAELGTFFNAIKSFFPTAVTWSIPSSGDVLQTDNGKITGGWSGGTAASIGGSGATAYVGGTGAFIRWGTSGVVDGRRVKGRTFLCPLIVSQFDASGTILDATVTSLNTAATTLAGSGKLMIYSRPTELAPLSGQLSLVTSGQCADKVTSLRTRRS
jgi:hypothetical protein